MECFWFYTIINCLLTTFVHNYNAQPIYSTGVSKWCEPLTDWSIPLRDDPGSVSTHLLPPGQSSLGDDDDLAVLLKGHDLCDTVWVAGVVDVAGRAARHCRVNHQVVINAEHVHTSILGTCQVSSIRNKVVSSIGNNAQCQVLDRTLRRHINCQVLETMPSVKYWTEHYEDTSTVKYWKQCPVSSIGQNITKTHQLSSIGNNAQCQVLDRTLRRHINCQVLETMPSVKYWTEHYKDTSTVKYWKQCPVSSIGQNITKTHQLSSIGNNTKCQVLDRTLQRHINCQVLETMSSIGQDIKKIHQLSSIGNSTKCQVLETAPSVKYWTGHYKDTSTVKYWKQCQMSSIGQDIMKTS